MKRSTVIAPVYKTAISTEIKRTRPSNLRGGPEYYYHRSWPHLVFEWRGTEEKNHL